MNRIILIIISLFISYNTLHSQVDIMESDTCLPRSNLYKYGYKIYELQRQLEITKEISSNKDSIINNRMKQIDIYKSTIKEQDMLFIEYDKSQKLKDDIIQLQKLRIEELDIKWYESKELWFGVGLTLGLLIAL